MEVNPIPIVGSINAPPATNASGGTVYYSLVEPFPGYTGAGRKIYQVNGGVPNWWGPSDGVPHLSRILVTTPSNLQTFYIMRPLNWTYFTTAIAKNVTAFTGIAADPGVYSTSYKYPTPGSVVPTQAADDTIASGDYVVYQLADGTWIVDTAASTFSAGAVTMNTGTPNRGGGILINSPLFYFGLKTDTDPATGLANPKISVAASQTNIDMLGSADYGSIAAYHPGDPLLVFATNETAQGWINAIAGFYGKF